MKRVLLAGIGLAVVAGAGYYAWTLHRPIEAPPELHSHDVSDPAILDLVQRRLGEIRESPRDALPRAALAMCYDVHGFPEEAAAAYLQALALEPDETRWRWHMARAFERAGNFPAAREAAERVIAEAPEYVPARRLLAVWLLARGETDAALAAAAKATEIDPQDAASWVVLAEVQVERGEIVDGESSARRAIRLRCDEPSVRRHAHWVLGRALAAQGRGAEAGKEGALRRGEEAVAWPDPWREELAVHRTGFEVLLFAAHDSVVAGHAADALPMLRELEARDPRHVQVLTDLGAAYRMLDRLEEAIAVLVRCAQFHPRASEPRIQLALALEAANRPEKAFAAIEEAIVLRPEQAEPYEVRGMMHFRADRTDDALRDFVAAFERDPRRVSALVHAGVAELERDRAAAALVHFERAAAADPSDADSHAGLAIVHRRLGDEPRARATLSRARSLAPEGSLLLSIAEEELGD